MKACKSNRGDEIFLFSPDTAAAFGNCNLSALTIIINILCIILFPFANPQLPSSVSRLHN